MLSKLSIRYEELPNTRVQPLNVLQGGDTSLKSKSAYVCVHARMVSVLCTYLVRLLLHLTHFPHVLHLAVMIIDDLASQLASLFNLSTQLATNGKWFDQL